MPSWDERARGAIWGQLVGDAAALGTHWIYDLAELAKRYPEVEGFEAPIEGHYHAGRAPGEQTHYGDGALCLLESVAAHGRLDAADFGRRFQARFSDGYTGYLDHATRETLGNLAAGGDPASSGADDDQLATASRLAAVVVAHHQTPDLPAIIERATRVTQSNPRAVAYNVANGLLLDALLAGETIEGALARVEGSGAVPDEVKERLAAGRAEAACDTTPATKRLGASCPLPKSFPSSIQALVKHGSAFEPAVLATVRAGGDNAGRAAMLGAWLGALHGIDAVPAAWRERLAAREGIARDVDALLAAVA